MISQASGQISLKKLKNALGDASLTNTEVASGLKEALINGVSKGGDLVSQQTDISRILRLQFLFLPK